MIRHSVVVASLVALVYVAVAPLCAQGAASLVNDAVSRHIDLSTHVAVVTSTIEVTARGGQHSSYVVWGESSNVASVTATGRGGELLVVESGEPASCVPPAASHAAPRQPWLTSDVPMRTCSQKRATVVRCQVAR